MENVQLKFCEVIHIDVIENEGATLILMFVNYAKHDVAYEFFFFLLCKVEETISVLSYCLWWNLVITKLEFEI